MSMVYMAQIMAECDCQHHACEIRGYCMAEKIKELEAKLKTSEEIGRAFEEDAGRLRAKLTKAVEGLKFYAEKEDYEQQWVTLDCGCCSYTDDPIILDDKGHLARSVLAKIKKETK